MGVPHPVRGDRRGGRPGGAAVRLGRRAICVVAAVLVLGLTVGTPVSETSAQGGAIVNANLLNLRAEPGTWAWVAAQMWAGEKVSLLAGPTADGWYQVQYGELVGWAYGGYLLIDGVPGWAAWPEPAAPPAPVEPAAAVELGVGGPVGTAWVVTAGLNVRAAPGDNAGILDVAGAGDALTVLGGPVNGYVPIQHWSGRAWVWGEFLSYGGAPGPERWVDVDRSSQTVTLFEGNQAIAAYWAAMGSDQSSDGFFATAVGTYYVYEKYRDLSWTDWGGAWVRNWVAFDASRLNGFHSFSMDAAGQVLPNGAAPTGGCVALAPEAAARLFDFLALGSRVEVHW